MHIWKFFRTGELDQVSLETGADLRHLDELDQKLWVALSCPVKGLELDEKTLALIDTDGDGHIRVPELIAAIKWADTRLEDLGDLLKGGEALPLKAINSTTPEGKAILASARQILSRLGRNNAEAITADDASDTAKIFSANALNGDGVIPPEATEDPETQALIKDIIACLGGTADRTGQIGVTSEQVQTFYTELTAYADWVAQSSTKDIAILGDATDAAVAALRAVRGKVEDFFARCRLAAYDPRALTALHRQEAEYLALAAKDLKITVEEVVGFPLSRIEAGCPLRLLEAVNPAWAAPLATLHQAVVTPIHGAGKTSLTAEEWAELNGKFAAYETWLGGKAGSKVEQLGLARVKVLLHSPARQVLDGLIARDKALEPEFKSITDVARLAHYYRDLRALLHNFVNFADFYSRDKWAIFQAGTLYLDSRSAELCLKVDGPNPLAAMSKIFLAYCTCTRAGGAPLTIAAAFTQGTSDFLFVGRHGVFYDRQGRDWDAVITSLVEAPISLRQAFWSPYKKFVRMIDQMAAKRAAAADAASNDRLTTSANLLVRADQAAAEKAALAEGKAPPPPPPPKKIDVGTVAALGVGVGAIGGALAAVTTGLARIAWWQYPLVLVALILVISIPAVIIAWLKLRQRTLGPVLDANGWAINGRVKINIPFGTALTEVAHLPPGAKRSLEDPYEDKEATAKRRQVIGLIVILVLAALAIRVDRGYRGHYFWQGAPAAAAPAK
ncbi:MAG: hypothetical protein JWQ83_726 [Lacunisphaera sp.]|nr:hypothetical protein [Lacunisphaera sp.]MDB6165586.1 hypothetical protein [Lacunisphaera sp.]